MTKYTIFSGPAGKWDLAVGLFNGEPVTFSAENKGEVRIVPISVEAENSACEKWKITGRIIGNSHEVCEIYYNTITRSGKITF